MSYKLPIKNAHTYTEIYKTLIHTPKLVDFNTPKNEYMYSFNCYNQ